MQYTTLLALAAAASAAPTAAAPTAPQTYPSSTPANRNFELQVHVPAPKNPDCHSQLEGRWLGPYHIGAGFNDVALYPENTHSAATLNGTTGALTFDLGSIVYNWTVENTGDSYKAFVENQISVTEQGPGRFFINSTGLQWTTQTAQSDYDQFGGWLACDWWRAQPTVFTFFRGFPDARVPKSCEFVQLLPRDV